MNESSLFFISIILYSNLLLILAQNNVTVDTVAIAKPHAKVCDDVRITLFELKRGFDAKTVSSCEIILGSLTYAPMHSVVNDNTTALIRFPNLREIHGYMLLGYSSERSFASMFPRLSVIHGRDLYHGYSLIVMDNFLLVDLGLTSLINIRRGNIIIARNAQLCYARSLDWHHIFETQKSQIVSVQNRDNCAVCPTCPSACWSPVHCQQKCLSHCQGNCLSETVCCPEQCVGGCHYNNITTTKNLVCNACRNMRIYATGLCVKECPENMLKAGGSTCVTHQECTSFFLGTGFILEEINECVALCPSGFVSVTGTRCVRCESTPENNYCNGECREKHIRSLGDFQSLKYCSRVHTLNIYNIETVKTEENTFLEAFSAIASIEQIDHEFTIHNVKIFSTLSIFSRLRRIGITSNATMTIEENEYLTELWPPNQQHPIIQGSLNIVRNARLCLTHIVKFINNTMSQENALQVSRDTTNQYANGYLTSCESSFLSISVDEISSATAYINVAIPEELFFRASGIPDYLRRPFLSVHYRVTQTKNETMVDTNSSHKWLRIVEKVSSDSTAQGGLFTMSAKLTSLLGDETYAVYASITSNLNTIGLFSPIIYFRTLERQPETIVNLHAESLSRSTIELVWQPPTKPNGQITTYLIYYAPIEDRLPINNSKLLCLMKDRWRIEKSGTTNNLNLTKSTRCLRSDVSGSPSTGNVYDEIDAMNEDNAFIDQIVTDLSILEYQLINSVSERKDPYNIQPDIKNKIIDNLDQYFEEKNNTLIDNVNLNLQEQPTVEHKPYINEFNVTVAETRVIIGNLKEAQMYMFQVYACHNISEVTLSKACSRNGIILAVRTKPGDPSRDVVHGVQISAPIEDFEPLASEMKSLNYQISWLRPLQPNGLIYFYTIYIGQNSNHGPKEELCVGNDVFSVNVTLLPRITYLLRITTYTIARLNNEYGDLGQFNGDQPSINGTDAIFEIIFTTKDSSVSELTRQNRFFLSLLLMGSTTLLLLFIIGSLIYYYIYARSFTKSSISKNPNYEMYALDLWEINKDSVTLDKLIGQGNFGEVYQGVVKLSDGTLKLCAIKIQTTHPADLLQEASLMKKFRSHHVVQLFGICSRIRPPYVVMELMENGDLKSYLYRYRQSEINPKEPTLSESAMIQLALDVADGMYYLSDQKFVHRDLAARNCLVNGNHTCKVGDFGLTRDIYETDYYRRGGRSFLPVRWMAPESLRDGRFDTISDVWSYGVLLWEIATLAEQPYQGYGNEEVVHYVRYGNITLERPQNCPEILHKLMRACWTFTPSDRISFRSIVEQLVPYENEDFRSNAYYHTRSYQNPEALLIDTGN